jgi:hypothetical protein
MLPEHRPDLPRLQRWMQEVIVHPGSISEAVAATEEFSDRPVDEIVLPSASLSAVDRIGVYHGMYLMRMGEALETDYPVIRYQLGEHQFIHLVRDYVQRHPSTSYTLNRLGDHLPQFFLDEPEWPQATFLHDLAKLELAMTEVFDEQESPHLGSHEVEAVPPESWDTARLRPIAAFRLLEFRHSVVPHLVAYHEDLPSPSPRRGASWVALYRRDYAVLRLELSRAEHDLLRKIVDGASLGDALASAAASKSPRQQAKVFRWFRTWISEGLFSAIEV